MSNRRHDGSASIFHYVTLTETEASKTTLITANDFFFKATVVRKNLRQILNVIAESPNFHTKKVQNMRFSKRVSFLGRNSVYCKSAIFLLKSNADNYLVDGIGFHY